MRASAGAAAPAALLLALLLGPSALEAMGSLPTGPSEGREAAEDTSGNLLDGEAAQVRLLADGQFRPRLLQEIAAARRQIVVATYLFAAKETLHDPPREIAEALAEAAGRGVQVRVVLEIGKEDSIITRANREGARFLRRRGVEVLSDHTGTTVHAKVIVIDGRTVFLGSHDLTHNSLDVYREASFLVLSESLARSLLDFVESLNPQPYREPRSPRRAR